MKQKRHRTKKIIRYCAEPVPKYPDVVCRKHNVSAASFYQQKKYGSIELKDACEYRQTEKENIELKQMRADNSLTTQAGMPVGGGC